MGDSQRTILTCDAGIGETYGPEAPLPRSVSGLWSRSSRGTKPKVAVVFPLEKHRENAVHQKWSGRQDLPAFGGFERARGAQACDLLVPNSPETSSTGLGWILRIPGRGH